MIPKIIHYCWINKNDNNVLPELVRECIRSWKLHLPEYEIKEWNITNFNMNINKFVKQAYEKDKYAFVSDYIRLYVLSKYGGIYLDTDVKVLKSFNNLLENKFFVGWENENTVATCVIGAEKENLIIKQLLNAYNEKIFINADGTLNLEPNTILMTKMIKKHNIDMNGKYQENKFLTIYPVEYFCPLNGYTGDLNITKQSYAIHLFNGSWLDEKEKKRDKIYKDFYQKYRKNVPLIVIKIIGKLIATYKIEGIIGIKNRFYKVVKRKIFN